MRRSKLWALFAIVVLPNCVHAQDTATYPRRITGEELKAHFKETWAVNGATSTARPITLYNDADGSFRIRSPTTSRVPDGFGKREVKTETNQVCLDMQTTSWRGFAGCYRLVETEPKAYSLVRGSYHIDYRR